jgi:hypothetical protein
VAPPFARLGRLRSLTACAAATSGVPVTACATPLRAISRADLLPPLLGVFADFGRSVRFLATLFTTLRPSVFLPLRTYVLAPHRHLGPHRRRPSRARPRPCPATSRVRRPAWRRWASTRALRCGEPAGGALEAPPARARARSRRVTRAPLAPPPAARRSPSLAGRGGFGATAALLVPDHVTGPFTTLQPSAG